MKPQFFAYRSNATQLAFHKPTGTLTRSIANQADRSEKIRPPSIAESVAEITLQVGMEMTMGLWSWLFDQISKPSASAPRERAAGNVQVKGSAIATLEAPAVGSQGDEPSNEPASPPWWSPKAGALLSPLDAPTRQPAAETKFLENILVSHFDGHDVSIPSLHNVAERVLPKLGSKKCNLSEVAREIADDQVLSAVVLRTANSPMYRGVVKITSVQAAVTRIGIQALRTILLHQSLRKAVFPKQSASSQFAKVLWRKSLADAHVMQGLSKLVGMDEEEGHLIGLMHDIGSVMVLRILNDNIKTSHTALDLGSFEYLRRQTHQEFGELIANAWLLPPELTSLITDHHRFPETGDPLARFRLMLLLAEMIGSMLYLNEKQDYDLIHGRPAVNLGLANLSAYHNWLSELPAEIDQVLKESAA